MDETQSDVGERLRAEARHENERLRDDPAYAAEMQAVREYMEGVRAW
jgi:hypothetical protein